MMNSWQFRGHEPSIYYELLFEHERVWMLVDNRRCAVFFSAQLTSSTLGKINKNKTEPSPIAFDPFMKSVCVALCEKVANCFIITLAIWKKKRAYYELFFYVIQFHLNYLKASFDRSNNAYIFIVYVKVL